VKRKATQITLGHKYRLTDVLWWTRQKDVLAEIAKLKKLPTVDTNTPGWLQHRLPASKNILDAMTAEEKRKFEQEAENHRIEGLPSDVQRK
jgi:hypothetical protein